MPEPRQYVANTQQTALSKFIAAAYPAIGLMIGIIFLADKAADAIKLPEKYLELKIEQASQRTKVADMERTIARLDQVAENAKVLADDAIKAVQEMKIGVARKEGAQIR